MYGSKATRSKRNKLFLINQEVKRAKKGAGSDSGKQKQKTGLLKQYFC